MATGHIVIWHIDKQGIESGEGETESAGWQVETLSKRVETDLTFYDCRRIHSANGYGCAFLDGNLSDIILDMSKYRPFLKFRIRPSSDLDQVGMIFEKLKQGAHAPDMDAVLVTSLNALKH